MATTEAWLRGPVPDVPPLLVPAAHAVQHALEDAARAMEDLDAEALWLRPGGAPPVGFHVRHLAGALDRLLTYARGEMLTDRQRAAAAGEAEPGDPPADAQALGEVLQNAGERALRQIRATPEGSLLDPRGVGRQQLPSTVHGIIFHAAEHAARHAGQALTTARIVRGLRSRTNTGT